MIGLTYIIVAASSLSPVKPGNLPTAHATNGAISNLLSIVFGIVGALALLMITISGLRYITSAGSPDKANRAREGVIYALVGLAIAISAEAIIHFVVNRL